MFRKTLILKVISTKSRNLFIGHLMLGCLFLLMHVNCSIGPEDLSIMNHPPVFTSRLSIDTLVVVGDTLKINLDLSDQDEDSLSFLISTPLTNMHINKNVLEWAPSKEFIGSNEGSIIASDGRSGLDTIYYKIMVLENSKPVFSTKPTDMKRRVFVGDEYSASVLADDLNDSNLQYIAMESQEGMSLSDRHFYWKPLATQIGSHKISIVVSDPHNKSDTLTWTVIVEPLVYISGCIINESIETACYWVKEKRVMLDTQTSVANKIFVQNENIYCVGERYFGTESSICYWKNTNCKVLKTGVSARGSDIFINNGDIFVTGYYISGSATIFSYWRNSQEIVLDSSDASLPGGVTSIFVSGDNVFVSGDYYIPSGSNRIACYWLNGKKIILESSGVSRTSAISVVDGHVIVAGGDGQGPCVWSDGIKQSLGVDEDCYSFGIHADNSGIFVAGIQARNENCEAACYWQGSKRITLTPNGCGAASDIQVCQGNVYCCGCSGVTEKDQLASWWSNGVLQILEPSVSSVATSLFIPKAIIDNVHVKSLVKTHWPAR